MIKFSKNIFLAVCLLTSVKAFSQSSTNSPYSQYGLGLLSDPLLPQDRAIGGIASGIRKPGTYNNVNLANPASYSAIKITTFDIGLYGGLSSLSKGGLKEGSFTGSLNHLVFGIPVTKTSALSFGLVPFSTIGYRQKRTVAIADASVNVISSGEGGTSKAYLGYGKQIGKHFSVGANASYIFGRLERNNDTESSTDPSFLNSRNTVKTTLNGLTFDYGAQYFTNISKKTRLTLGYSGTAKSSINSSTTDISTHYTIDAAGNESTPIDTTYFNDNNSKSIQLPQSHRFGFVLEQTNKWLIGADVTMANWSSFNNDTDNRINNSFGVALGAQITPDITSVGNYFKLVDYRFGLKYDKSYLRLSNTDIKQYAVTLGLGLPLPSSRTTFYKINLGAELGQRGKSSDKLVGERYANIYLGFTINDKWFQRYKFD